MKHSSNNIHYLPQHFHSRVPIQKDFIEDDIDRALHNLYMARINKLLAEIAVHKVVEEVKS